MKNILFLVLSLLVVVNTVEAQNVERKFRSLKLAGQEVLERQTITDANASTTATILSAQATSASVVTTVSSFLAQPDVPRNLKITPGGTTADVAAGSVTVTGTNFFSNSISESFTFGANATDPTTGSKAFKSVTSIVFHVQDGASATFSVGVGDDLGLKRCMEGDFVSMTTASSTYETTRPSVSYATSAVESNTIDPNSVLDGTGDIDVFFVQSFTCFP